MSYLPGARHLSSSKTLNIDSGWQRSLNPQESDLVIELSDFILVN